MVTSMICATSAKKTIFPHTEVPSGLTQYHPPGIGMVLPYMLFEFRYWSLFRPGLCPGNPASPIGAYFEFSA